MSISILDYLHCKYMSTFLRLVFLSVYLCTLIPFSLKEPALKCLIYYGTVTPTVHNVEY